MFQLLKGNGKWAAISYSVIGYFLYQNLCHLCIVHGESLGGGPGGGGYYIKLLDFEKICPLHSFCLPWNLKKPSSSMCTQLITKYYFIASTVSPLCWLHYTIEI